MSLIVSVPPVVSTALVSVRFTTSADSTAASLTPVMVTVICWVLPSMVDTVKTSLGSVCVLPSACTAGSALFSV